MIETPGVSGAPAAPADPPPDGAEPAALAALPRHPVGTFAFVGTYAVIFVALWFAIYYFIFLARQPVTP